MTGTGEDGANVTGKTWPDRFEKVLRAHVPDLTDDVPLDVSTNLPDLGLDSLATVALLVELEETFDVTLPDDDLSADTFATPGNLWSVLDRLLPPADGR